MRRLFLSIALTILRLAPEVPAATIHVPVDLPTIQAAINSANNGDLIVIAAGMYNESLSINKSLTLAGSGTNTCTLYSTNTPAVVSIAGPGSVQLNNFEIVGGQYVPCCHYFASATPQGIVASNIVLSLNNIVINQIMNEFVIAQNDTLFATNVAFFTRAIFLQADIGFQISRCTGTIYNLTQDAGQIDHTINIDPNLGDASAITVDHCRINASHLSFGNCVRTYTASSVLVTNCFFYRPADTTNYPGGLHNGVGINGYSNAVIIADNIFSNLPWAVYCYGSLGGNRVSVKGNTILNSTSGGVSIDNMTYEGIDLGGGAWGSPGNNRFQQTSPSLTNYSADVFMQTNAFLRSTSHVFALHNVWSNPTNQESVIFDKRDNPAVGRVIADDLVIQSVGTTPSGQTVLNWNERSAGEKYTVEFNPDLSSFTWTNLPGVWPITNPNAPASLVWTNPLANSGNIFYRVRSQVP